MDLDYPFQFDDEGYIYGPAGRIEPKLPTRRVDEIAEAAISLGATIVRKWTAPWGIAAGFSLPGTITAWFVADDFQLGRFSSLGIRMIQGVAFAAPISIYSNDVDQAARFTLAYGLPRNVQNYIERTLALNPMFPVNKQTRKLWGGGTDAYEYHSLLDALRSFQRWEGIDPYTTTAASKTVEIVADEYSITID